MTRGRPRRSGWGRGLGALLLLLLLLLVGAYVSLPFAIQRLLPDYLARRGILLSIDSVEHDLLAGELILHGVELERDGPALVAEQILLGLDLGGLARGKLALTGIELAGATLTVARGPGGAWRVAGLGLAEGRQGVPGVLALGRVELRDSVLRREGGAELQLAQMALWDIPRRAAGGPLSFRLAGTAAAGQVSLEGQAWPWMDEPALEGRLKVSDMDLARFSNWARDRQLPLQEGTLEGDARLRVTAHRYGGGLVAELDGRIRLDRLAGEAGGGRQLRGRGFGWQGQARLTVPGEGPVTTWLLGRLDAEALTLQWPPAGSGEPATPIGMERLSWDGRLEWFSGPSAWDDLALDGDAEVARLSVGQGDLVLERATLWGLKHSAGEPLSIGRVEAGGVHRGDKQAEEAAQWRARRLAGGEVRLGPGARLWALHVDMQDLRVNAADGHGVVVAKRVELQRLDYLEGKGRVASLAAEDVELAELGRPGALTLGHALALDLILGPEGSVEVDEVRLRRLGASLVRDEAGAWALEGVDLVGSLPRVRLGVLDLGGASRLTVSDEHVVPPFRLEVASLEGRLAGWDSVVVAGGGRFSLRGDIGETGRIALSGRLGPAVGSARVALHGDFSGIDLSRLPSAVRPGISGNGRLAGDVDLTLADRRWSLDADLRLGGLTTEAGGQGLTPAVRFLSDERGSLRLALSVSGTEGGGNVPDALAGGVEGAFTEGVLGYYRSLGATPEAAERAAKLGELPLQPVRFVPGSGSFDRTAASFLEALADRMKHRPLTRVRVCAVAVHQDLARSAEGSGPSGGAAVDTDAASDRAWKGLALAGLRDGFVRDHLVKERGLGPNRLLACEPRFDEAREAGPRVELTLVVGGP